jgi:hypothetical protein
MIFKSKKRLRFFAVVSCPITDLTSREKEFIYLKGAEVGGGEAFNHTASETINVDSLPVNFQMVNLLHFHLFLYSILPSLPFPPPPALPFSFPPHLHH